jgi:dihydrodipicolinate synthase/N-acetylneuraminate lyase
MPVDPCLLLRPGREIHGISAILLPFTSAGEVDWRAFSDHVARTAAAGITPAINMDTGYVQLIADATRDQALRLAREAVGDADLVAGACVCDKPGAAFDKQAYGQQFNMISAVNAVPVVFPSFGLGEGSDKTVIARYRQLAEMVPRFIGFELAQAFAPSGRILGLEAYAQLIMIPNCIGAKHSSLSRQQEWERLQLRDRLRPGFHVYTGNDLAIDMVRYGSDWLLGLSTAWPEAFAQRDRWWAARDSRFDELDDALQALGDFAFREPVPAYKHSLAQVLCLRGLIESDKTHPQSPQRPDSDRPILKTIISRIEQAMAASVFHH